MARRSKSDKLGLNQRIVDLHDESKLSHSEISDVLKAEGSDISRESVRRSYNSSARKAEKYKIAAESCKIVLDGVKDGSNMDMVEASAAILNNMFYDKILEMDGIEFKDSKDFIRAIRSIGDMQVKVSQFRLSFDRGVSKAKNAIYDAMAAQLSSDPELLKKLGKVIFSVDVKE